MELQNQFNTTKNNITNNTQCEVSSCVQSISSLRSNNQIQTMKLIEQIYAQMDAINHQMKKKDRVDQSRFQEMENKFKQFNQQCQRVKSENILIESQGVLKNLDSIILPINLQQSQESTERSDIDNFKEINADFDQKRKSNNSQQCQLMSPKNF